MATAGAPSRVLGDDPVQVQQATDIVENTLWMKKTKTIFNLQEEKAALLEDWNRVIYAMGTFTDSGTEVRPVWGRLACHPHDLDNIDSICPVIGAWNIKMYDQGV